MTGSAARAILPDSATQFAQSRGTVKAAIGASYIANRFTYSAADNTGNSNLTINPVVDALHTNIWATFAQVNVPLVSDTNAFFGARRVDLEVSWRHDQYDTLGGTSDTSHLAPQPGTLAAQMGGRLQLLANVGHDRRNRSKTMRSVDFARRSRGRRVRSGLDE